MANSGVPFRWRSINRRWIKSPRPEHGFWLVRLFRNTQAMFDAFRVGTHLCGPDA